MLPSPHHELTIPGFTLGHGTDLTHHTGVTVLLCPEGALAAAEVRGSATGTRQFDSLLLAHHVASRAHAVVLSGGSGAGLASADPVVDYLVARNHGFRTGFGVVPTVPTAILFDLGFGQPVRPQRATVEAALADARAGAIARGSLGAGTGATCGKAKGLDCAMKGGFGFVSLTVPGGPTVAAAVAVNAFGDVRHPDTARLVAGCRTAPQAATLAHAEAVLAHLPPETALPWEGNTTLAVVMTDADLPKAALYKVAQMAFGGFYRALSPALTVVDGDLVVVLSRGRQRAHPNQVGVLAERAVALAIVDAVENADGFGLLPTARDLPATG
jgi:L-aminopeptidase/D-esterase-like protein